MLFLLMSNIDLLLLQGCWGREICMVQAAQQGSKAAVMAEDFSSSKE